MKKQTTLMLAVVILLAGKVSAQERIFILKSTGQTITKAQVDSMSKTTKLQYNIKMVNGQQVVEVASDNGSSGNNGNTQQQSFSSSGGSSSNSNGQAPNIRSKTYKDENGNVTTEEAFKAKAKSGDYQYGYSTTKNDDGSLDVTYILKPKKQAEEETKAAHDGFTSKLMGAKLPDFDFQTMDGKKVSLSSLEGKVVVLNFWFIGCAPCVAEMPALNQVVDQYKSNSNVVFLSLSFDKREEVRKFLEKTSLKYQVIPETMSYNSKLNMYAYPTQIILNKKGVVNKVIIGGQPEDTKAQLISSISSML